MLYLRAYATVWDFINSIFGSHFPSIPPNTYGFFLAIAFVVGIIIARNELARKTFLGIFPKAGKTIEIGKGIEWFDVILYSVFGLFIGLKLGGILADSSYFFKNAQTFILSLEGSKLGGIIGAILWGGYIAYTQLKNKKNEVEVKVVSNNLEDRIGDILIISMLGGVIGSKLMDALDNHESMADFLSNPIASLTSGLSILGGLGTVSILLIYYAWKNKINILAFTDSLSLPFFISYAIGRLGCQFSGDGCWGISVADKIKPSFLPDFLWGNFYPHNVNRDGIPMMDCAEPFCTVLAEPHLPTPLYETIIVTILFLILWSLRKKLTYFYGAITGLFLIFNGIERFLIEFVRVNTKYQFLGFNFSQAQYISILMILIGGALTYWSIYIQKEQIDELSK